MSGTIRFLDPRERNKFEACATRDELMEQKKIQGTSFANGRDLDDSILAAEEALSGSAVVACFKCGLDIDLASDHHYRMSVTAITEFSTGSDPAHDFFTPPTALKLETGDAGVIALLVPPLTGELAICDTCYSDMTDYLSQQEV